MLPADAEMLRHKFLAASYTPQGSDIAGLFSRMDITRSGTLELHELLLAVRKLIPDVTDVVVENLLKDMDTTNKGYVIVKDLEEFINQRHSIQVSPDHQRSGMHRTATKAAAELCRTNSVGNHTFAKDKQRKQQGVHLIHE
jgi:hypothetical protein